MEQWHNAPVLCPSKPSQNPRKCTSGRIRNRWSYSKYKAPHPSPMLSDWTSEDWDSEKAKVREQRSLIDLDPPKPDLRQTTDSKILNELPIQNLTIQIDGKEEEKSPEITDTLVPLPEMSAGTPMTEET